MPWVDKVIDEPLLAKEIFRIMQGKEWKIIGDFIRVAKCNSPVPVLPGKKCGEESQSGGSGVTEISYVLGSQPGIVTLSYDSFSVPDMFELIYKGQVVATTYGLVSGAGVLSFHYNPPTDPCFATAEDYMVTVRATGNSSNTGWVCTLNCPGVSPSTGGTTQPVGIPPEKLAKWEEEFRNKNFINAASFAVAHHWIIENKKKMRYGMAYVVRSFVSKPNLIQRGILDEWGSEHTDPSKRHQANLAWVRLGREFINDYVNMAGCPVWYFYSLNDYYGPKIQIDHSRSIPYTDDEILVSGMGNLGGGIPDIKYLAEHYPNIEFKLTDHLVRTGSDLIRSALDLENFTNFTDIAGLKLRYFDNTKQSPIIPLRLRDTSMVDLYSDNYDVDAMFTNWYVDSKVSVQGYYDEKSAFFTLRADEVPWFEYFHGIPVIPMFFGEFDVPFNTDKGGWATWNGNQALFGGTVIKVDEPFFTFEGCCRADGERPFIPYVPPPGGAVNTGNTDPHNPPIYPDPRTPVDYDNPDTDRDPSDLDREQPYNPPGGYTGGGNNDGGSAGDSADTTWPHDDDDETEHNNSNDDGYDPNDPADKDSLEHPIDWQFLLRWESSTSTDLDLHAYYNHSSHVWWKHRKVIIEGGGMWLDFDYTSHGIDGWHNQPEVITEYGLDGIVTLQVRNYDAGPITDDVHVQIINKHGVMVKEYLIPPERITGNQAICVADVNLATEEVTDIMKNIPNLGDYTGNCTNLDEDPGDIGGGGDGGGDVTHDYDYKFLLRWEDNSEADLDFHGFIGYNNSKHVSYEQKEYTDGTNKVWLDYDYTSHGPNGRDDQPEVITVQGFTSSMLSLQIHNYNGETLNEDVTVEIRRDTGTLIKKYSIPASALSGKTSYWVCDVNLSSGSTTDRMKAISSVGQFPF